LRLKGWGSPNSNEGTYTVVLYIYKYFVFQTVSSSPSCIYYTVLVYGDNIWVGKKRQLDVRQYKITVFPGDNINIVLREGIRLSGR
jgi:hypothetical protein